MLQVNHCDVRHSAEMQTSDDPLSADYARYIQEVETAMRNALDEVQTVVITARAPEDVQSIQPNETIITLRAVSDLDVYRMLLGVSPEALAFQFLQGQLSQAMTEVNLNVNGREVRPVEEI